MHLKQKLTSDLIKDILWTFSSQILIMLIVLFVNKLVSSHLGVEGFALYSIAKKSSTVLVAILAWGITIALPRYLSIYRVSNDKRYPTLFPSSLLLFSILSAGLFLICSLFPSTMREWILGGLGDNYILMITLFYSTSSALNNLIVAYFRGKGLYKRSNIVQICTQLSLFIGAFYAMHYHADYQICPKNVSLPLATDTLLIRHSLSIRELSEAAEVSQSLFKLLNPQYKQGTVPGHISPCSIRLPMKAINRLDRRLEELYQNVEKVRLGKMTSSSTELLASDGEGKEGETTEVDKPVVAFAKTTTYTIRKGDTLAGIAQKHGITMDQLMQANNIKNTRYKLVPGNKLIIPVKDASPKVTKTKATRKTKKKPRRRRR